MCPKDPGGGRRRMGSGTRLTRYRELRPPLPAPRPPSPVRADRHRHRHLGTGHRAPEATDIHRQEPRTATRRRRRTTVWPLPRWSAHSSFGSTEWVRFWPLSLASSPAPRSNNRMGRSRVGEWHWPASSSALPALSLALWLSLWWRLWFTTATRPATA